MNPENQTKLSRENGGRNTFQALSFYVESLDYILLHLWSFEHVLALGVWYTTLLWWPQILTVNMASSQTLQYSCCPTCCYLCKSEGLVELWWSMNSRNSLKWKLLQVPKLEGSSTLGLGSLPPSSALGWL